MRRYAPFLLALSASLLAATPEQEVRDVLQAQTAAWNRGDLVEFVRYYSPESVFIGKEVSHGNAEILQRYQRTYATRDKMGSLEFTDVEVRVLGPEYASVIGRFHLTRTPAGGGDARGIYNLLFRKTPEGWKIILDHTS